MEYGSFRAEEFGDLQRLVDGLFYDRHAIDRLDLIVQAEILDASRRHARRFVIHCDGLNLSRLHNVATVAVYT